MSEMQKHNAHIILERYVVSTPKPLSNVNLFVQHKYSRWTNYYYYFYLTLNEWIHSRKWNSFLSTIYCLGFFCGFPRLTFLPNFLLLIFFSHIDVKAIFVFSIHSIEMMDWFWDFEIIIFFLFQSISQGSASITKEKKITPRNTV